MCSGVHDADPRLVAVLSHEPLGLLGRAATGSAGAAGPLPRAGRPAPRRGVDLVAPPVLGRRRPSAAHGRPVGGLARQNRPLSFGAPHLHHGAGRDDADRLGRLHARLPGHGCRPDDHGRRRGVGVGVVDLASPPVLVGCAAPRPRRGGGFLGRLEVSLAIPRRGRGRPNGDGAGGGGGPGVVAGPGLGGGDGAPATVLSLAGVLLAAASSSRDEEGSGFLPNGRGQRRHLRRLDASATRGRHRAGNDGRRFFVRGGAADDRGRRRRRQRSLCGDHVRRSGRNFVGGVAGDEGAVLVPHLETRQRGGPGRRRQRRSRRRRSVGGAGRRSAARRTRRHLRHGRPHLLLNPAVDVRDRRDGRRRGVVVAAAASVGAAAAPAPADHGLGLDPADHVRDLGRLVAVRNSDGAHARPHGRLGSDPVVQGRDRGDGPGNRGPAVASVSVVPFPLASRGGRRDRRDGPRHRQRRLRRRLARLRSRWELVHRPPHALQRLRARLLLHSVPVVRRGGQLARDLPIELVGGARGAPRRRHSAAPSSGGRPRRGLGLLLRIRPLHRGDRARGRQFLIGFFFFVAPAAAAAARVRTRPGLAHDDVVVSFKSLSLYIYILDHCLFAARQRTRTMPLLCKGRWERTAEPASPAPCLSR
mmetsp:Transcript_9018/g.16755  ORF Transcript_9018/g.16755 Transcript_9018/m.16755 type:complete len:644 (+) Transcript_9018:2017-3948(+)